MAIDSPGNLRNRLLLSLMQDDFQLLAPHLEFLKLPKSFVLVEADKPIDFVYFLESGVGSIIAASPEGQEVEVGLFGRDGFAPLAVILGAETSPNRIFVQVVGDGYRIPTAVLIDAAERSPSLRAVLLRYVQVLNTQASYTALSNAVHPIDERLARWLLMCHDRHVNDELPMTHEFLSIMLAVRRPSVTTALHVLEGNGFIRSERGYVIITNRKALEDFARDAYGKPEAEFKHLIGSF